MNQLVCRLNSWILIFLYFGIIAGNQPLFFGSHRLSVVFVAPAVIIGAYHFFLTSPSRKMAVSIFVVSALFCAAMIWLLPDKKTVIINCVTFPILMYSGGYAVVHHRQEVSLQLYLLVVLSIVFALFQVSGTGSWSLAHADLTDNSPNIWLGVDGQPRIFNVLSFSDMQQYSRQVGDYLGNVVQNVFLRSDSVISYVTLQYRPPGVFPTNTCLSFFILMTFAFIYRQKKPESYLMVWPLCLILVLSMAKIAFLGVLVLLIFSLFVDRLKVSFQNSLYVVGLAGFSLLYRYFFPVFASSNQSFSTLYVSFFSRFVNLVYQLPPDSLIYIMCERLFNLEAKKIEFLDANVFSSYQLIVQYSAIAAVLTLVFVAIYAQAIRKTRLSIEDPDLLKISGSLLFLLLIFIGAVPFHTAKVYWYFFGMALSPILIYSRIIKIDVRRKLSHESTKSVSEV